MPRNRLFHCNTKTRDVLVDEIIKAQDDDAEKKSSEGDDGWAAALGSYAPKLKLGELELDWGVSSLLLTPVLWPVLMWREPISRAEVYGPLGTPGRMLEALSKRWTTLLGASDGDISRLTTRWTTLWILVGASRHERPVPTPRQWMRDHHELQVLPLTRLMLELQSNRARTEGQTKLSQRLMEVASVPTERLGYDVQEMAQKIRSVAGGGKRSASESDEDDYRPRRRARRERSRAPTGGSNHRAGKGRCRWCNALAQPKDGTHVRDWFKVHNAQCPKKPHDVDE